MEGVTYFSKCCSTVWVYFPSLTIISNLKLLFSCLLAQYLLLWVCVCGVGGPVSLWLLFIASYCIQSKVLFFLRAPLLSLTVTSVLSLLPHPWLPNAVSVWTHALSPGLSPALEWTLCFLIGCLKWTSQTIFKFNITQLSFMTSVVSCHGEGQTNPSVLKVLNLMNRFELFRKVFKYFLSWTLPHQTLWFWTSRIGGLSK